MAHVQVRGRRMWVDQRPGDRPLLCIQGMSGTHVSWGEPFLEALQHEGLGPIAFDHRGVGRSDPEREPFSIRDLADDAAGLLDALGLDGPVDVLGISMGGMVAQELALSHPDRVRTLVLGCTYAGGPGSMLTRPEVGQRLAAGWGSGDRELALRTGYEVNVSKAFAAREGAFDAFREMALKMPAPIPVILLQVQAIGGHDTSARIGELRMPVLVLHGDEDEMLDIANGRAIAAAIPGARLEVLEGVGHMFWWEQPERSAELIGAFARGQ